MDFKELQVMLEPLIGQQVVCKKIAGNSISLWFSVVPMAGTARVLWLDAPWRIETPQGVESTSLGFPYEMEEEASHDEYRARCDRACARSDCLQGTFLTLFEVNHVTGDLTLQFNNDRILRSFAICLDEDNWHFSDYRTGKSYRVFTTRVEIEEIDNN